MTEDQGIPVAFSKARGFRHTFFFVMHLGWRGLLLSFPAYVARIVPELERLTIAQEIVEHEMPPLLIQVLLS